MSTPSETPEDPAPPTPQQTARPRLLRSTATTLAARIGVAVLSFVSVLITARALGADGRGSVAFLTMVGNLVAQLATLGIFQADANFAAREPHLTRSLAGTSVGLSALFGVLAAGCVALLVAAFPAVGADSDPALLALVLAAVPGLVLLPCLDQLLRAHYEFALANAAWLLTVTVPVVANGLLVALGGLTIGTAVAAWVSGQLLGTGVLAWGVATRLGGFGRFDRPLARRMLGFGLKAYFGRVMLLGNYRLDQWLLGGIAGPRELGLYSVAVAWAETLFFLPTALSLTQRPDLVRATREGARRRAALGFRAALVATLGLAIAMAALAPLLCATVFGEPFRGSVEMLRVLAVGVFGIVALKLLGNALTAQRKPMLETAAIALAFVCIVVLDVILIPAHGGVGAAWASAVAYSVGGIAVAAIFVRALGGRARDLLPHGRDLAMLRRRLRPASMATDGPPSDAP